MTLGVAGICVAFVDIVVGWPGAWYPLVMPFYIAQNCALECLHQRLDLSHVRMAMQK